MKPPMHILLVEDDPSITRLINSALEDYPLPLLSCDSIDQAWALLEQKNIALVITDLMLPTGSGSDLLHRMQGRNKRPYPPVIVLSAGITSEIKSKLIAAGAYKVLYKPVSIKELLACIDSALDGTESIEKNPAENNINSHINHHDSAEKAVDIYFAGNIDLFKKYRAGCCEQFPVDIRTAETAITESDYFTLQRIAHNLKTVLLTIGYPNLSTLAGTIESMAAAQDEFALGPAWSSLQQALSTPEFKV